MWMPGAGDRVGRKHVVVRVQARVVGEERAREGRFDRGFSGDGLRGDDLWGSNRTRILSEVGERRSACVDATATARC